MLGSMASTSARTVGIGQFELGDVDIAFQNAQANGVELADVRTDADLFAVTGEGHVLIAEHDIAAFGDAGGIGQYGLWLGRRRRGQEPALLRPAGAGCGR